MSSATTRSRKVSTKTNETTSTSTRSRKASLAVNKPSKPLTKSVLERFRELESEACDADRLLMLTSLECGMDSKTLAKQLVSALKRSCSEEKRKFEEQIKPLEARKTQLESELKKTKENIQELKQKASTLETNTKALELRAKMVTDPENCCVCMDSTSTIVISGCNHELCEGCFEAIRNGAVVGGSCCPLCRQELIQPAQADQSPRNEMISIRADSARDESIDVEDQIQFMMPEPALFSRLNHQTWAEQEQPHLPEATLDRMNQRRLSRPGIPGADLPSPPGTPRAESSIARRWGVYPRHRTGMRYRRIPPYDLHIDDEENIMLRTMTGHRRSSPTSSPSSSPSSPRSPSSRSS